MSPFESKEIIARDVFVDSANQLLAQARQPDVSLETALEAAQQVANKVDAVATGAIEVKPPLEDGQLNHFREFSATVISLCQTGLEASAAASTTRGERRRARRDARRDARAAAKADRRARQYQGKGDYAKV